MIIFWIAAALLSAGAGALVLRGAAAARPAPGENPALAVHRRQLAEIDNLAERGLLAESEHKATRAEAGRRLLDAADAPAPETRGEMRLALLILAAGAPLAAAALYVFAAGAPGAPDQPFMSRVPGWRAELEAQQARARETGDDREISWPLAITVATADVQRHPKDAKLLKTLAITQLYARDGLGAEATARRLLALNPRDPEGYTLLAAAFARETGQVTPGARQALDRATALAAALPPADPARDRIAGQVQGVYGIASETAQQAAGQPEPAQQAGAGGDPSPADIRGMVTRLAERLKAKPDDPQGWIMLVRAYGVIGEFGKRDEALANARERYADKPDILAELAKAKDDAR